MVKAAACPVSAVSPGIFPGKAKRTEIREESANAGKGEEIKGQCV